MGSKSLMGAIAMLFLAAGCAEKVMVEQPGKQMPHLDRDTMPKPLPGREAEVLKKCGADRFQHLVGQPREAIDVSGLPELHRIVCHGCMVTKDYRVNRLNIWLDAQDRVEKVDCG